MRIAWLCPYLPQPENSGGRIRIANLARAMSAEELHLYVRASDDGPDAASLERSVFPPWQEIHARSPTWPRKAPLTIPALPVSFPSEIMRLIAAHDREHAFDALIIEHCYSGYGLPELRRAAVILSEHNVESEYWLRELRMRPKRAFSNGISFLRWRRFERQVWQKKDLIVVVSDRDREHVQRVASLQRACPGIEVIPNGVALDDYNFIPPSRRQGCGILFVGLFSYLPNVEAAGILARRVLPLVLRQHPEATLTLAGRDPHPMVRELANPSVRVTGTVANIAQLFDDHAVFANPMTLGAGSSLKVLEAMATGIPLVSTGFSVRGFGLEDETHYLRGDTPEELARTICRAFEQRASLDGMARRAREVAERYRWSKIRGRFAEVVERAVENKKRSLNGGPQKRTAEAAVQSLGKPKPTPSVTR